MLEIVLLILGSILVIVSLKTAFKLLKVLSAMGLVGIISYYIFTIFLK